MKKIKIHFGFYLIIIASFFLNFGQELLLSYGIVLLHELAHILAAGLLGIKLSQIEILPFGIAAKFKIEEFKPKDEIIFSLAGPLLNLCLLILSIYYSNQFLIAMNATLLIINLLPIVPLDGGRALRAYLSLKWGSVKSYNFTKRLSQISLAILIIFAISLLIISFNISFLIICAFLMVNISNEHKHHTFLMLKNGILNDIKLQKQPLKTETLTVTPNFLACKALKHFDGNNYYNIQVVEEDKIIKTLTERELIKSLRLKSIRQKISEVIASEHEAIQRLS